MSVTPRSTQQGVPGGQAVSRVTMGASPPLPLAYQRLNVPDSEWRGKRTAGL
jgi:hypothetical protein